MADLLISQYLKDMEEKSGDKAVKEELARIAEAQNEMYGSAEIEEARRMMADHTVVHMTFTTLMENTTLASYNNETNIWYKMTLEDAGYRADNGSGHRRRITSYIAREMTAVIKEIDEVNRTIWLKYEANVGTNRRIVNELRGVFATARKEGRSERINTAGKIMRVHATYATVDIVEKGVIGTIDARNWSNDYTADLSKLISSGEVYNFDITGMRESGINAVTFVLDHKPYSIDPWKRLPEKINLRSTLIPVSCSSIDPLSGNWYGNVACEGTPLPKGMTVKCIYNSERMTPRIGSAYLCRIIAFKPERKFILLYLVSPTRADAKETVLKPTPVRKR